MITMTEIARLTGVSQPTVSRVLNGNTNVKPEIREKVLACAKEHGFQPNIMAQSLRGEKTHLIGVIIPDISNPFFGDVVKVIEAEAVRYGYSLMLFNTNYNTEQQNNYLEILKRYRVDGLLLISADISEQYADAVKQYELPKVVVTQRLRNVDSVFISHSEAGRKVARHLLNLGYSSFIYVGDANDEKERGFRAELEAEGIDLEHHYHAVRLKNEERSLNDRLLECIAKEESGDGIGIFAYNDVQALIVLSILQEAGAQIPEDIALVGFDNTYLSKEATPKITTVAQPVEEIGRLAVERLTELIEDTGDKESIHVQLETRLVIRASTVKVKKMIQDQNHHL